MIGTKLLVVSIACVALAVLTVYGFFGKGRNLRLYGGVAFGTLGAFGLASLAAVPLAKFLTDREPNSLDVAVLRAEAQAKEYNAAIEKMARDVAASPLHDVAATWEHCAVAKFRPVSGYTVASFPSESELDACEIAAVQLASTRGADPAAASQFAQDLRRKAGEFRNKQAAAAR